MNLCLTVSMMHSSRSGLREEPMECLSGENWKRSKTENGLSIILKIELYLVDIMKLFSADPKAASGIRLLTGGNLQYG